MRLLIASSRVRRLLVGLLVALVAAPESAAPAVELVLKAGGVGTGADAPGCWQSPEHPELRQSPASPARRLPAPEAPGLAALDPDDVDDVEEHWAPGPTGLWPGTAEPCGRGHLATASTRLGRAALAPRELRGARCHRRC